MIHCHYCQSYKDIPKSLRRITGDTPARRLSYRYCRHVRKEVVSTTKACKHFIPATHFWCKKWNGWLHIIMCLYHHANRTHGCVLCKQYKNEVADVARGRDLYAIFGKERKNHVNGNHKQLASKPILRRRKEQ